MSKVRVTVFGFSKQHSGKGKVSEGSYVVLKKDPDNSKDKDAIKVLTENELEQVGWVGNSPHMVADGTRSASRVNALFVDKCLGKIVAETEVQYSNGHRSKAFIVEMILRDEKGEDVKMEKAKKIVFKLVGSKSQYPIKFERLIPDFNDGKEPYIQLKVENDQIVAEYDGQLCGYVSKEKDRSISAYEDVLSAVGEKQIAKVTKISGTKIIGEFTVDEKEIEKQKAIVSLNAIVENIINQGLSTKEEMDERIQYLKDNGVTEKQMLALFKTYKKYEDDVEKLVPSKPKTLYQDSEGIIKRSIAYINVRRNLLLEGDRGVGKNIMIETLAWLYKRPLYELSLNSQYDNTSIFGGKIITVDENGNEITEFEPEVVVQAGINGGFLTLDEINTSLGHVMTVLHPSLDDRRRFNVPGYGSFIADDNFIAIATMNKDYQATFELNEATADRFVPIVFPKAKTIIPTLVAKTPEVDFSIIQKCDLLYKGIVKCVQDGEIGDRAITVRGFIDACMVTQMDIPLKDALMDNVANRCPDLDDRIAIKNMIEDILG